MLVLTHQCNNYRTCVNSSKDSDDENVFNFKCDVPSNNKSSLTSPLNIKQEPLTGQTKTSTIATIDNPSPCKSSGSSVVALTAPEVETIVIEESQPLFEDCSETYCEKLELKLQAVQTMASELKISDDEKFINSHRLSCSMCEVVSVFVMECQWRFDRECEAFVSKSLSKLLVWLEIMDEIAKIEEFFSLFAVHGLQSQAENS